MNQIAPSAEHLWLVPNLHDAGCHGSLAVVGMRLEALNAQVVMLASLVLAGCAASEQGDRTVACAPFQAGWACSPNTQYVTIIQGESTASQCAEACEKIGNNGCCWHSEEPDASDSCQWVLGGQARDYGGPTVRSAAQCTGGAPPPPPLPQQLHIALGNMSDSMLVQWAVPHLGGTVASPNAVLRYQAVGDTDWVSVPSQWSSEGPGEYTQHRVTLTALQPATRYAYEVGFAEQNDSFVGSSFRTQPVDQEDWSPRLVMFGDLGWTDDQVLPYLRDEVNAGAVDAMVLFGDFVYWDNGENENSFMRDVSAMSGNGSVPIMVSPGNGDYGGGSFSRYRAHWAMPGWEDPQAYALHLCHSFDIGRAHIVGINTELIEYGVPNKVARDAMLAWLEADLTAANSASARAARPWIIVHFHRPAYSTGNTDAVPFEVFEPLMFKYSVDVVFAGHVHNQERTLPVYNRTVLAGPDPSDPYRDAGAPVYIVSGNPGNAEETNYFNRGFDPWTAWRSYAFGYAHMVVHNATTLGIDFVSTNLGGAVTDEVFLTKSKPCNFGDLCPNTSTTNMNPRPLASRIPSSATAATIVQRQWRAKAALSVSVPDEQVAALVALYNATNGSGWYRNTNWLHGNPCDASHPWYGVSCAQVTERTLPNLWNTSGLAPRGITAVQLPSNNLVGLIPIDLGPALSSTLQLLDLSSNYLRGTIPQTLLKGLPVLHTLFIEPATDLAEHKLAGTLPEEMGAGDGLPNLRFLALTRNALTGSIPASLGNLSCHVTSASGQGTVDPSAHGSAGCLIWLSSNNFTGSLPRSMCSRTYNEVYIAETQISCPVPCLHVGYSSFSCTDHCTPC